MCPKQFQLFINLYGSGLYRVVPNISVHIDFSSFFFWPKIRGIILNKILKLVSGMGDNNNVSREVGVKDDSRVYFYNVHLQSLKNAIE